MLHTVKATVESVSDLGRNSFFSYIFLVVCIQFQQRHYTYRWTNESL